MKKAKIAELKNSLSMYLAHVKRGGTVLVFERDRPVACLVPVQGRSLTSSKDRLAELERRGIVRRGSGGTAEWLRSWRPVRVKGGLLKTVLAERKSGW
jgi:antitoxin (DNA-binding transcriptional repressor) of toxin-antitoxin stability system